MAEKISGQGKQQFRLQPTLQELLAAIKGQGVLENKGSDDRPKRTLRAPTLSEFLERIQESEDDRQRIVNARLITTTGLVGIVAGLLINRLTRRSPEEESFLNKVKRIALVGTSVGSSIVTTGLGISAELSARNLLAAHQKKYREEYMRNTRKS